MNSLEGTMWQTFWFHHMEFLISDKFVLNCRSVILSYKVEDVFVFLIILFLALENFRIFILTWLLSILFLLK